MHLKTLSLLQILLLLKNLAVIKKISNILDTRGRFHVSSIESFDKISGIDSELLALVMQDPTVVSSQLSLEDKYSHLLNHCNKQRVLIDQLLSFIRQNSGGNNASE